MTEEEWRIVAHPRCKVAARALTAPDRLVKEQKRKVAQDELERTRIFINELTNVLHFKHLGILQPGHRDPRVRANRRIAIAIAHFRD